MVHGGKSPIFSLGRPARRIFFAVWVALVSSCAQTFVQPIAHNMTKNLPAPTRILVYDFAVDNSRISEYQGIMRQQPSVRDPQERQRALGKNVGTEVTVNLIVGLRRMGFAVERAPRGTMPGKNDLIIDGRVLIVDEGNPLRRLAIGFGSGAARLETQVGVSGMNEQKQLLEFSIRTDSGRLPGAVVTLPVGAALPVVLSLGVAVGSAVAKGVNENSAGLHQMAVASAEQTVQYLRPFFARQGWIRGVAADNSRPAS
jgi:Domain of unknown function (DUF4410)